MRAPGASLADPRSAEVALIAQVAWNVTYDYSQHLASTGVETVPGEKKWGAVSPDIQLANCAHVASVINGTAPTIEDGNTKAVIYRSVIRHLACAHAIGPEG